MIYSIYLSYQSAPATLLSQLVLKKFYVNHIAFLLFTFIIYIIEDENLWPDALNNIVAIVCVLMEPHFILHPKKKGICMDRFFMCNVISESSKFLS